jgi:hypothetical protein
MGGILHDLNNETQKFYVIARRLGLTNCELSVQLGEK